MNNFKFRLFQVRNVGRMGTCKLLFVTRTVMSVSEANDNGKACWFTPNQGSGVARAEDVEIRVKGEFIPLNRVNGVFEMKVKLDKAMEVLATENTASPEEQDEQEQRELEDRVGAEMKSDRPRAPGFDRSQALPPEPPSDRPTMPSWTR